MKVTKITNDRRNRPGYFLIWVWALDEYRWKECPYAFKYEDEYVYFLPAGQEKDKKLVGMAYSKDAAIKDAIKYLEAWLRECGVIN